MNNIPEQPVSSPRATTAAVDTSVTSDTLIHAYCQQMRATWPDGKRLHVEDLIDKSTLSVIGPHGMLDLIYSEYVIREMAGERPQIREFLDRFPQYRSEIERQLHVHDAVHELALPDECVRELSSRSTITGRTNPTPLTCPDRIGRYRIIEQLGSGGQADVFRAVHPVLGIDVVIKLALRECKGDAAQMKRFFDEGRAMAKVDDPRIARVYDVDIYEGRPFLVMELLSGQTLKQHVATQGMPVADVPNLVAELAIGLAAAHRQGITHRDVKPANIIMTATGQPRLVDFGVAELTSVRDSPDGDRHELVGTLPFMAPEQARGEPVDHRADVFSLGAVLHWLLTGKPPFGGSSFAAALEHAQRGERDDSLLQNANAPRRLKAVCRRALAPQPEDRYQTADQLADALRACDNRRKLIGMIAATILFAGIAIIAYSWPMNDATPAVNGLLPITPTDEVSSRQIISDKVDLAIRVWRSQRFFDLADVIPTRSDDQFRFDVRVPGGRFAALIAVDTSGKPQLLAETHNSQQGTLWKYPEAENEAVPLTGPAGTVAVFVCVDPTAPISPDTIRSAWNRSSPLPIIPAGTLVCMEDGEIRIEDSHRDFGLPGPVDDPASEVAEQLRQLRTSLAEMQISEAIAFPHEE